jgi:phosphoglycolate phosphatase
MHLLIDLDGTLTDPFPGITRCIQFALDSLGLPVPLADSLRWCIGPPLQESFAILLGTSNEHLANLALTKYRERFSTLGRFENQVYPGIESALAELNDCGHSLLIATSKPRIFARPILDHFRLAKYFRSIDGSELDGTRKDKTELIAHILQRDGIAAADAIMIGDREHDIIGARQNRVAGLGVLWGYGSREELESAGACACIRHPTDLAAAVSQVSESIIPIAANLSTANRGESANENNKK